MKTSADPLLGCLLCILCVMKTLAYLNFWAVQRPLGSMFAVLWYEMSYENVLRRFGDFCIVVEAVLCTAQRLNINPCCFENLSIDIFAQMYKLLLNQ